MNKKKLISESYIELVVKANTTNVKVSDICERACVSRKTFYYYFKDKQDIIEHIFCEEIEKTMINGLKYEIDEKTQAIITYREFLRHKAFFIIAMKDDGQNSLFEIIIDRCTKFCRETFDQYFDDKVKLDYLSYKYASTSVMLLKKWMNSGMQESPEFLAEVYLSTIQDIYLEKIKVTKHK